MVRTARVQLPYGRAGSARPRRRIAATAVLLGCAVFSGCQAAPSSDHNPTVVLSRTGSQPVIPTPRSPGGTAASVRKTSPAAAGASTAAKASSTTTAASPAALSDAQLVGQLFVSYVYGSSADAATPAQRAANLALYGAATPGEIVRRWHLGGIILIDHNNLDPQRPYLSTGNVQNGTQIRALTAGLQQVAKADTGTPLLIGTDQEGGSVQRIENGVAWRPSELALSSAGPAAITCSYYRLGQQLLDLGVNQDYAPVADVVRASGGVIGDRSFGSDASLDARDVVAAVTGLQSAGVLATLKHWPGHGSTPVDSHAALPVIDESGAQWSAVDRPPFLAGAPTAAAIMVGHLALPALDPSGLPATLSPTLIRQTLRGGLGYLGLVMTDSLWMAPMMQAGSPAEVAVRAIRAGDDMLLMSPDLPGAYAAVLAEVRISPAFRAQVGEAVQHVLAAKARTLRTPTGLAGC